MLVINEWYGRLGNNVLQIIRAIHYAIFKQHNIIRFKPHQILKTTEIKLDIANQNVCNDIITNNFFNLKTHNMIDPEPYEMKQYFQKYVMDIFAIEIKKSIVNMNTIFIHFRGGDIFSNRPHSSYVQPPLYYYNKIIEKYDNAILVGEDKSNPCINELLIRDNIKYVSNSLKQDLELLTSVTNLAIGFGTFGFLLYLINVNLKNLYIPKYFIDELPKGNWGNDLKVHIIDLPGYIKVGEWKNTKEQQKVMLDYYVQ